MLGAQRHTGDERNLCWAETVDRPHESEAIYSGPAVVGLADELAAIVEAGGSGAVDVAWAYR
jgi:hypothetical protein